MSSATMEEMNIIFKFSRCKWKIKQWAALASIVIMQLQP